MNVKIVRNFLWFSTLFVFLFAYFSPQEIPVIQTSTNVYLKNKPEKVILGGNAVGFEYQGDGVLVLSNNRLATMEGYVGNLTSQQLAEGDIILKINAQKVSSAEDVSNIINSKENAGKEVELDVIRANKELKIKIVPMFDLFANKYKLGVWIKDSVSGIGTLTYVCPDTKKYAALGHPIMSGNGGILGVKTGKVYNCNIIGIARGSKGVPGELRGVISKGNALGTVESNTDFGIYGEIQNDKFLNNSHLIDVGGRKTVKPGKAKIYSSIDGEGIKAYDIQIIKTNYQSVSDEKSLVFKVTDKELLSKTGGILQGMSGSPIVQNNKLVGAVTHVFLNDSTKGFGLYIDWMM